MLSKKTKILRLSALSLAVAGALGVSQVASAKGIDITGSAGVANMYLWRGINLGGNNKGAAAVSGSLQASYDGGYAGMWGSSGDNSNGTELDFYTGYGTSFKGVTADLSVWNYYYPNAGNNAFGNEDDLGGLSEVVLSLGFMGVTATGYHNISGNPGAGYYTLAYSYKAFTALVGHHDNDGLNNMTHVDLSYAYNDNLTFTLSQQVDREVNTDHGLHFVVAYSLPIGK